MRLSNRDWIAWSVLTAIVVVVAAYYAHQQQTATAAFPVYKIVVTAERPGP